MAWIEKYVTETGAGLHDGTSEADAWDLTEALASVPVAGTRFNIKSGNYSIGLTTFPAGGTDLLPIMYRGYSVTPGDLDNNGWTSDGWIITTGFPLFTVTNYCSANNYSFFQCLEFVGSLPNNRLLDNSGFDFLRMVNCKMTQNGSGSTNVGCVRTDDQPAIYNCDFICTGAVHGAVFDADLSGTLNYCRFKGSATAITPLVTMDRGFANGCIFEGSGSKIQNGIQFATSSTFGFTDNTFYNLDIAISFLSASITAPIWCVNNHVTDCNEWMNSTTLDLKVYSHSNRFRDVGTLYTNVDLLMDTDSITIDSGGAETDFVDASSGDFRLLSTAAGKSNSRTSPIGAMGAISGTSGGETAFTFQY